VSTPSSSAAGALAARIQFATLASQRRRERMSRRRRSPPRKKGEDELARDGLPEPSMSGLRPAMTSREPSTIAVRFAMAFRTTSTSGSWLAMACREGMREDESTGAPKRALPLHSTCSAQALDMWMRTRSCLGDSLLAGACVVWTHTLVRA
jgi:hypothetical protein